MPAPMQSVGDHAHVRCRQKPKRHQRQRPSAPLSFRHNSSDAPKFDPQNTAMALIERIVIGSLSIRALEVGRPGIALGDRPPRAEGPDKTRRAKDDALFGLPT